MAYSKLATPLRDVARRSRVVLACVALTVVIGAAADIATAGAVSAARARATTTTTPATPSTPAPLPSPRPEQVLASGSVSMFPVPGTQTASAKTGVTFRPVSPNTIGTIAVSGSSSGMHSGTVRWSSDSTAAMWFPDQPFTAGETVTVATQLSLRGGTNGVASFRVATLPKTPPKRATSSTKPANLKSEQIQHFVTRPDLSPPALQVVTPADHTAAGDIFLTPNGSSVQQGPLVVDDAGNVVWDDPNPGTRTLDLAVQRYHDQPVLTWYEGTVTSTGVGRGTYVIMDEHYRQLALVAAGNGYAGDLHEFQITPQDTALFTVYSPVVLDASSIGGSKHQTILEGIVQEVDIPTGVVLFEWHTVGNIGLDESYQRVPKTSGDPYDYVHANSIAVDTNDNLLVSGRHTFTTYAIDRTTGALIWRLGGKKTNFTMGPGAAFAWQHDVRNPAPGIITAFDNGASEGQQTHKFSRGIILRVDNSAMRATLVREYTKPKHMLATSQGDFQTLSNGDFLIGWGSLPEYTEFDPQGRVVLDVVLPKVDANTVVNSYRAYRFAWDGTPTDSPRAVASMNGAGMKVSISWNGATDVATWQVLGGPGPDALSSLATQPKSGFETTISTTDAAPYVQVRALGASGDVLGTSALVSPVQ